MSESKNGKTTAKVMTAMERSIKQNEYAIKCNFKSWNAMNRHLRATGQMDVSTAFAR